MRSSTTCARRTSRRTKRRSRTPSAASSTWESGPQCPTARAGCSFRIESSTCATPTTTRTSPPRNTSTRAWGPAAGQTQLTRKLWWGGKAPAVRPGWRGRWDPPDSRARSAPKEFKAAPDPPGSTAHSRVAAIPDLRVQPAFPGLPGCADCRGRRVRRGRLARRGFKGPAASSCT